MSDARENAVEDHVKIEITKPLKPLKNVR